MTSSSVLSLNKINHHYFNFQSLNNVNFSIDKGDIVSLLGPSGSGKTTILRVISGLERISSGQVLISNQTVSGNGIFLLPHKRKVGLVFQDYALFPHLKVKSNISYGVQNIDFYKINEVIELLEIKDIQDSYPYQISGGQQQRVALARALVSKPEILLLDEPFVRLENRLREKIRDDILHILKKTKSTAIIVTHDSEEAMFMSDKIVVINKGTIVQEGRPLDIYTRPNSKFIAEFFGDVNIISGTFTRGEVKTKFGKFKSNKIFTEGKSVNIVLRHEGINLVNNSKNIATIVQSKLLGKSSLVHLQIGKGKSKIHLHAKVPGINFFNPGSLIGIEINPLHCYVFE